MAKVKKTQTEDIKNKHKPKKKEKNNEKNLNKKRNRFKNTNFKLYVEKKKNIQKNKEK